MAYFNGLSSNTNWEELSRKVEAYCAADQFIAGKEARGEFRRSMASTWLRHDPAAALAWFASNCDDPHPNYDSNGSAWSVVSHAVIIREWLREDLAGATQWLATWQSDRIPIPEVLAKIADWQAGEEGQDGTSKITDAVRKLIELSVLEARSVGVEERNGPVPRH